MTQMMVTSWEVFGRIILYLATEHSLICSILTLKAVEAANIHVHNFVQQNNYPQIDGEGNLTKG